STCRGTMTRGTQHLVAHVAAPCPTGSAPGRRLKPNSSAHVETASSPAPACPRCRVNCVPVARKPKRRQQTRVRRPAAPRAPGAPGPSTAAGPRPGATVRPSPGMRIGGDQALVRAVEGSLAPTATRRGGRIVLENADPAIPLDRVPYFLS